MATALAHHSKPVSWKASSKQLMVPSASRSQVQPLRAGGHEVDLFPAILTHVADPHVVGEAVEGEAPRVAQAPQPDVPGRGIAHAGERVIGRRNVRISVIDVDAEDLGQARGQGARAADGVEAEAAVADPDVEHAVRSEQQCAAVVLWELVVIDEQDLLVAGVGDVRIGVAPVELPDVDASQRIAGNGGICAGKEHEYPAVPRVTGVKREADEPLLVALEGIDRDERGRPLRAVLDDGHRTGLLGDEVAGLARRDHDRQRLGDPGRDGDQPSWMSGNGGASGGGGASTPPSPTPSPVMVAEPDPEQPASATAASRARNAR